MFENAIENVLKFSRPLHSISRTYGGLVSPGTSTFFFVNNNGVAITCKHVVNLIPAADNLNQTFIKFKAERDNEWLILPGQPFQNQLSSKLDTACLNTRFFGLT